MSDIRTQDIPTQGNNPQGNADRRKTPRAGLKTEARKLNYKLKHDLITPDRLIFFVAGFLCLSWAWGAISALSRNWELAQRLESRRRELAVLRLEVENLELENEYYRSDEYQELAARAKQNKLLPGESLVYLPDNTEAAKTKHQTIAAADYVEPSNFSQWLAFLFGS